MKEFTDHDLLASLRCQPTIVIVYNSNVLALDPNGELHRFMDDLRSQYGHIFEVGLLDDKLYPGFAEKHKVQALPATLVFKQCKGCTYCETHQNAEPRFQFFGDKAISSHVFDMIESVSYEH